MGSGECTDATCPVGGGYFSYKPSQAGNGILLGCFVVLIPLTTFFGLRYRTAMYSALLMAGLVFEVLCYIGRLLIHGDPRRTSYFVIFLLGSSLGPTFITTAIFYVLPRVMTIYDHDLVEVRPKYFNYLFFAISLLTLTLQAAGSVFAAIGDSAVEIDQGMRILAAGFGVQIGSLVLFFITYYWFLGKKHQRGGRLNPENAFVYESSKFRLFVLGWQLASWFILIRTVFRLVESLSGLGSSLAQTEAAFMVLDGAEVVVASVILTAFHPGKAFGKMWSEKPHDHGIHSGYDGVVAYDASGNRRSYSPRRGQVPAQLPLAYSNKYPQSRNYSPTQISPAHTANTTPGFSPGRYQDSPKYSPTSAAVQTTPGARQTNRFSMKSSKSGGAASSAAHDSARRSPRQNQQTQSNLVSSDDLW